MIQDSVRTQLNEKENERTHTESRAVASELRDAAAVVSGLKFAGNIHYKFESSQASKAIDFRAPNIPAQNRI